VQARNCIHPTRDRGRACLVISDARGEPRAVARHGDGQIANKKAARSWRLLSLDAPVPATYEQYTV